MFMGRLALQRGGTAIDDPNGWFNSLPDSTVEFWQAFYRHEPFGGEWQRNAKLCQMVHLAAMRTASGDNEQLMQEADFMPADFINLGDPNRQRVPITEQLEAVRKAHAS